EAERLAASHLERSARCVRSPGLAQALIDHAGREAQDVMINMRGLLPLIVSNALNVLGAILILLIGLWLGAERRDHDRTVDADTVHRSDHLFACAASSPCEGLAHGRRMISIEGM